MHYGGRVSRGRRSFFVSGPTTHDQSRHNLLDLVNRKISPNSLILLDSEEDRARPDAVSRQHSEPTLDEGVPVNEVEPRGFSGVAPCQELKRCGLSLAMPLPLPG